ncbi:MAG: diguanylate cyclase, partial [Treponema sp.]|nr:diguanylate cyclase [Treponema sp.]
FLGDVRINTTITKDGRSIAGTTLEPDIAEIVINNRQEYSGNTEIFGEKYRTFYKPLLNARGEAFAVFFLGNPETGMIAASNRSIREGIVLGLCGLAASIVVLIIIISSISKPITRLSADMDRIADGDLNVQIDVKSEDEVGHLARSFQKVADTMHKLLNDINVMIEEHERGNTDYSLQTGEFRGDYKNLALSVMRFSTFGMRDQLTGLPNRRSFENRLNWEWKQTIAKKSPISMLIIDVDHFKKYSDSYGHPQGDLALQTIAQKAMEAIRHQVDFIARREGDEIVVILPETESEAALAIAEKIRTEIKGMMIPCVELGALNITVSIGVSTQSPAPGRLVDDIISAADSALYRAKETGRDRVYFCGEADGQRTGA